MYVVFKVEKRRSFLDCREVYWTGEARPSGEPSETVSLSGAIKFLSARTGYKAAGEQGRLDYWRVGPR